MIRAIKSWILWVSNFIRSIWYLLVPGAGVASGIFDHLLDTRLILSVMQPVIVIGLVALAIDCGKFAVRGLLLGLACLAAGFLAGFLFGIPKVLQGSHSSGVRTNRKRSYQQKVNTNLEEISDWLTKIIVGLGLVEMKQIPAWIGGAAVNFASAVEHPDSEKSVFSSAIVLFSVSGFLAGYLVTRLYLQGALSRADRTAVPDESAEQKKNESEAEFPEAEDDLPADEEDEDQEAIG